MKTLARTATLLPILCAVFGCASPYMINRGRDAADILTATVGTGLGVGARAGFVGLAPVLFFADTAGLEGGARVALDPVNPLAELTNTVPGIDAGGLGWFWLSGDWFLPDSPQHLRVPSAEGLKVLVRRGKAYEAVPVGKNPIGFPPFLSYAKKSRIAPAGTPDPGYYYTQMTVFIALGVGVHLGINPGELLDFLLGWTTVDVYGDDTEHTASGEAPGSAGKAAP